MPTAPRRLLAASPVAREAQGPRRRFARCVETLSAALRLPVPNAALGTVRVVGPRERMSRAALLSRGLSPAEARRALSQYRAGDSSFWPKARLVLLASRAPSHLAEEAAHFLRDAYAPFGAPASERDAFYLHTVEEALAFFASKLICPSRRPCSWQALWHAGEHSRSARAIARTALAHLAPPQAGGAAAPLYPADPSVSDAVSHLLGYRLGQALYAAVQAGACDERKVLALFTRPTSGKDQALLLYWQLTAALRHYLPLVRPPTRPLSGFATARAT